MVSLISLIIVWLKQVAGQMRDCFIYSCFVPLHWHLGSREVVWVLRMNIDIPIRDDGKKSKKEPELTPV